MNILISAFLCDPTRGSDHYVGWANAVSIAKYNDVYLMTRTSNKEHIEMFCADNKIENIDKLHFIYVDDINVIGKFISKCSRYWGYLYNYNKWQKKAYLKAKEIYKTNKIDICHHISVPDFRVAGYLWKLDVPFIYGPVGGGQGTPNCLRDYVRENLMFEKFRDFINWITVHKPSYKKAINKSRCVYCSNDETVKCVTSCGTNKNNIFRLTELCVDDKRISENENYIREFKDDKVHIIVAGRLIYRKGIALLLDAISQLDTNFAFCVDIYGDGQQRSLLEQYSNKLNLQDIVTFHGNVSYDKMQEKYRYADIYCLPSIRETTGTALFEAMLNHLPVVALNQHGAKYIVEQDAGILVDVVNKNQVIKEMSNALKILIENPDIRQQYGNNGYKKMKDKYTWSRRAEYWNEQYKLIKNN